MTHTPAPWEVIGDIDEGFSVIATEHDLEVAEIFGGDEIEANARLIAAAPSLLEALIEAEIALNHAAPMMKHYPETVKRHHAALDKARAAIRKAKGEAA